MILFIDLGPPGTPSVLSPLTPSKFLNRVNNKVKTLQQPAVFSASHTAGCYRRGQRAHALLTPQAHASLVTLIFHSKHRIARSFISLPSLSLSLSLSWVHFFSSSSLSRVPLSLPWGTFWSPESAHLGISREHSWDRSTNLSR